MTRKDALTSIPLLYFVILGTKSRNGFLYTVLGASESDAPYSQTQTR